MYAIAVPVLVIGNQKVGIASYYLSSAVCFFVLRVHVKIGWNEEMSGCWTATEEC